jgi:hypothetical protein
LEVEHLHRICPRCNFGWAEAIPKLPDHPIPLPISLVRPEVAAFALLMERELAKHDDRTGWKTRSKDSLVGALREMVQKLAVHLSDNPGYVGHRAANAANYCMMIADVCGALGEEGRK